MSENLNKNESQQEVTPQEAVKETKSVELKLSIPKPDKNMIDKIKKGAMGVGAAGLLMLGGMHFGKGAENKAADFDTQIKKIEAEKIDFVSKEDSSAGSAQKEFYNTKEAEFDSKLDKLRGEKDALFKDKNDIEQKNKFEELGKNSKDKKFIDFLNIYKVKQEKRLNSILNRVNEPSVDEENKGREENIVDNKNLRNLLLDSKKEGVSNDVILEINKILEFGEEKVEYDGIIEYLDRKIKESEDTIKRETKRDILTKKNESSTNSEKINFVKTSVLEYSKKYNDLYKKNLTTNGLQMSAYIPQENRLKYNTELKELLNDLIQKFMTLDKVQLDYNTLQEFSDKIDFYGFKDSSDNYKQLKDVIDKKYIEAGSNIEALNK